MSRTCAALHSPSLFVTAFLCFFSAMPMQGQLAPFQHQTVVNGINRPVSAVFLPDNRMLILKLYGQVLITSPVDQPPVTTQTYMQLSNVNTPWH
jgi:hypothetical protein